MAERENSTFLGALGERHNMTRGGFSRQAETPTPSLTNAYDRSTDTVSPALEMGAAIGADTYVGAQSQKVEHASEQAADFAYKEQMGLLGVEEARQLEASNKVFQKYARARRQGATSDYAANIAVEAEIKRVANQFPALGPQVRRAAAQLIGFDPTGAEYSFLTNPNRGREQAELPIQKAQREAQYVESTLGLEEGSLQNAVLQNFRRTQELSTLQYQERVGRLATTDVINMANIERESFAAQLTSNLYQGAAQDGGVQNLSPGRIKNMQAQITAQMYQGANALRTRLAGQSGMTTSEINSAVNDYKAGWESMREGLSTFTSTEYQKATIDQRNTAIKMWAQNNFPLMYAGKALGFEGEDNILFMDVITNPDKPLAQRLIKNDPVLRRLSETGNMGDALSDAIIGLWSGDMERVTNSGINADRAVKIASQYVMDNPNASNIGDGEAGSRVLETLFNSGNGDFALDQVASNPDKYMRNKGVINSMKNVTSSIYLSRMAQSIKNEVGDRKLVIRGNNTIGIAPKEDTGVSLNSPNANLNIDMSAGAVQSQLSMLNKIGTILDNASMASQIGISKAQLVKRINSEIENPTKISNSVTTGTMTPVSEQEVQDAALTAGISPNLYTKLISQESNMGRSNPYSSAGAAGVAQFMPATARDMGLQVNDQVDERLDSRKALYAGAQYFKQMRDRYDDDVLGLAAYNWGPGRVDELLKDRDNPVPDVPSETKEYVEKIAGVDFIDYLRTKGYIASY